MTIQRDGCEGGLIDWQEVRGNFSFNNQIFKRSPIVYPDFQNSKLNLENVISNQIKTRLGLEYLINQIRYTIDFAG